MYLNITKRSLENLQKGEFEMIICRKENMKRKNSWLMPMHVNNKMRNFYKEGNDLIEGEFGLSF